MRSRGKQRGRRGGRGRTGASFARRVHSVEDGGYFIPPLVKPTLAQNLTGSATFGLSYETTTTAGTFIVRVEDVIDVVRRRPAGTINIGDVSVRINSVMIYASIRNSTTTFVPTFTMAPYCMLTLTPMPEMAAEGSVSQPARRGYRFPRAMQQIIYRWDGTRGTSARLVDIRSGKIGSDYMLQEIEVQVNCSYILGKGLLAGLPDPRESFEMVP